MYGLFTCFTLPRKLIPVAEVTLSYNMASNGLFSFILDNRTDVLSSDFLTDVNRSSYCS